MGCLDSSQSPRVLLTGHHSSLDVGHMAIVLGTVCAIRSVIPDSKFILLSGLVDVDRERYTVAGLKIVEQDKDRNTLHWIFRAFQSMLLCLTYRLSGILPRQSCNANSARLVQAFQDSSIVVDLSALAFRGADGKPSLYVTLKTLQSAILAKIMGKKFVLLAQTIELPFSWRCKFFAELVIFLADTITAREKSTYSYLRKSKVKASVYLTADPAYLVEAKCSARVRRREVLMARMQRPLVAVLPRRWTDEWLLVLKGGLPRYIDFFARLVDLLIEDLGCTVLLLPHWTGPGYLDDRPVIRWIRDLVDKKDDVLLVEDELTEQERRALFKKCDIVVSANLHATISAASMGVPFIVLGSSTKFGAITDGIPEIERHFVDVRGQGTDYLLHFLKGNLSWLINNLEEEKRKLKEVTPRFFENSLRNGYIIAHLMGADLGNRKAKS
jgi:polysaccharide pyruvyl transferase WcaK-like protein